MGVWGGEAAGGVPTLWDRDKGVDEVARSVPERKVAKTLAIPSLGHPLRVARDVEDASISAAGCLASAQEVQLFRKRGRDQSDTPPVSKSVEPLRPNARLVLAPWAGWRVPVTCDDGAYVIFNGARGT